MLVVRKQGGRNINNDRYVYINVDDDPKPLSELRRLLDLNLAYVYEDEGDRLLAAGKRAEALSAGRKAVAYAPKHADSHTGLGFLEYINGNKQAALKEFQEARKLDPDFKKQFEATISWEKEFKTILQDKEFLDRLFPK
jgi:tetratricopeptide (TPR) repeat protein